MNGMLPYKEKVDKLNMLREWVIIVFQRHIKMQEYKK